MSVDDFQTKYASVMENMLKSAVAETTKLFETMVDELKAEIARIKTENEDLKMRCSQFESARSQLAVCAGESEPLPGRSDDSRKRDTAIQCDLVPFHTILVEHCQPLRHSSLQNLKQQCGYEEMEYALKEHNYETHGEENSQMAFKSIKQENDCSLQSVIKQEETESTVVCSQTLSDKADSPWASACGIEKELPVIYKVCSLRDTFLLQRKEETQVALELEHPLVVSHTEIKDDMEEERELMTSETHQVVYAQPQSKVEPLEKEQPLVVPQQCQREDETVNEQTDITLQQYTDVQSTQEQLAQSTPLNQGEACYELKNGKAEVEASSQSDVSVRRRRGRPPKKGKYLQQPVKKTINKLPSSDFPSEKEVKKYPTIRGELVCSAVDSVNITSSESPQASSVQSKQSLSIITPSVQERENTALEDVDNSKDGSLAVSVASLSSCSSEKEKTSESQKVFIDMEEGEIQAPSTEVSSAVETLNTPSGESPQAPSVQPREHQTSVTLQDAMLLVEAMNQTMVDKTFLSPQRMTAEPQTQCVPHGGALQTVDEVPAEPQNPALPVETHDTVGNLPTTELSSTTQLTIEKLGAPAKITDATATSEAQAHIKVNIPKRQHTVSLSNSTSSMPASTPATQTSVLSLQQHAAVVRLTRLPFPVSTKESFLVSRLPTRGSSDFQSVLKEDTTQEKSPSVISTQPSKTLLLSTDTCPSSKETSVAVSAKTSQMSEESNDIQEKVSISSENCTTLEESPNSSYVQPSILSKVSQPVFEKSTMAINTTEPSAICGAAGEPTSNLDEEIISIAAHDCALPNDQAKEEKQPIGLIHLTSITSKDIPDPHLQLTKSQFLAQLAVSTVAQDQKRASSSDDSADVRASCAETSTTNKKRLPKHFILAQLQSHIKTHLQARRTETNPKPRTETEIYTVSSKKPGLENDYPNDNTTSEPIPLSLKNPGAADDVTSLKKTTNDPTPISPKRSGRCKDGVKPKRTVSDSSFVNSKRPNATSESTPVSPRRSSSDRDVVGPKNKKSTSLSPRRTSSTRDGASPKNTKTGSPNNTKITSVRPKGASLSKNGTSLKMSTFESTSVIHRRCTFSKDGSSTKLIKRVSKSLSPRWCSTATDGASTKNTRGETDSPSVRLPKLAKTDVSPRTTDECTSFKKPRLIQDGTSSEKNLRVVNANKLAKAAKAKTIAKMKNSNQSKFQSGAKTSQLADNSASSEAVKKCTVKAVWTPPQVPASETPLVRGKRSAHLPVKKETNSPRSQDHTVVYPPSVSLHPIPVKAPSIVSPLQPLSVIGWRLLKNQCGECGRVLSSSAALESHVSLHKGRRPFSCTLCGKRFPDSKALKRHGRVHRNGRIHICQKCGKGFVYRFCLTKHLQMVHSKIRPFVCQICNKGFSTKRDVEAHIRLHTGEKPFHCNLCEKKFARRVDLNVHLRWHNGEKRHWCPYCGKGFLDFNNLKRHKFIHTGEKPHSCPHCPKNFTQSGHLKKHVKNVHKIQ